MKSYNQSKLIISLSGTILMLTGCSGAHKTSETKEIAQSANQAAIQPPAATIGGTSNAIQSTLGSIQSQFDEAERVAQKQKQEHQLKMAELSAKEERARLDAEAKRQNQNDLKELLLYTIAAETLFKSFPNDDCDRARSNVNAQIKDARAIFAKAETNQQRLSGDGGKQVSQEPAAKGTGETSPKNSESSDAVKKILGSLKS